MNPIRSHELAIVRIGRYLVDNLDRGVIHTVDKSRGLEIYADADFVGGWNMSYSTNSDVSSHLYPWTNIRQEDAKPQ